MKLTENELNYILSEIAKSFLNEELDGTSRQINKTSIKPTWSLLQNDSGETMHYRSPEIVQKPNWNKKKVGRNLKKYGGLALGAAATATLGAAAAIAFNSGFGDMLSGLGFWGGIGSIIASAGNSLMRYKNVKQMKLPSSEREALNYARYAAAEREQLQEQCKILQRNVHNAFNAYRTFCKPYDLSWDEIINNVPNKGYVVLGGKSENGQVKVNYKTDFEDRYVKESVLKETNEGVLTTSAITPTDVFLKQFNEWNSHEEALGVLIYLIKAYNEMYGLWMFWSHYIGKLIAKFPKTLNWEVVIDSNKNYSTGQIINNFAKAILPKAISQFIPDYQKKSDENKNEFDDKLIKQFTFILTNKDYKSLSFDKTNSKHFFLFECEENYQFYALQHTTESDDFFKGKNVDTKWHFKFSKDMVVSTIKTDTNQNIFVLSPSVLKNITEI
jgi:hypothetical protein